MMLEALAGEHPFSGRAAAQHNGNVLYSIAHYTSVPIPSHISPDCADFISKAMHRDPALRPSAEQLLQHPFMTRSLSAGGAALGLSRLVITPRCSQEAASSPKWQHGADYSSGGAGWGASGPSFTGGASGYSPMAQWPAPAAASTPTPPGCGVAAAGGYGQHTLACRKPVSSGGAAAVRAFLTADSWEY
jgi:serine/threonine protein kinase